MGGQPRQKTHKVLGLVVAVSLGFCVVLWTAACGGGGVQTTTTTGKKPATTTSVSLPSSASLLGTTVKTTEQTPQEFVQAYGTRPIVVFFYVPGNADDGLVLESVQRLERAFSEYVFLAYDYRAPAAYGDLPTLLKVGYPPQLVLIDKKGVVREVWNGYIDEGSLNQKLVELGRS